MQSKLLTAFLLLIAVAVHVAVTFFLSDPWTRLSLGFLLLAPILWASSQLGMAEILPHIPTARFRPRHFSSFRKNVAALMDEVRRLNWLAVDRDRGFRDRETIEADIKMSEQRLEECLVKIRRTAGESDDAAGAPPVDTPAGEAGEPPVHDPAINGSETPST